MPHLVAILGSHAVRNAARLLSGGGGSSSWIGLHRVEATCTSRIRTIRALPDAPRAYIMLGVSDWWSSHAYPSPVDRQDLPAFLSSILQQWTAFRGCFLLRVLPFLQQRCVHVRYLGGLGRSISETKRPRFIQRMGDGLLKKGGERGRKKNLFTRFDIQYRIYRILVALLALCIFQ